MKRFYLVMAMFYYVEGTMTVTPRNQVVIAGQRMEMECGVEGSNIRIYNWDVTKPEKATEKIVLINGRRYTVGNNTHLGVDVNNSGSGIIYYNSTQFEEAGIYICNAIEGGGEKTTYSAQLIVLESLPNCASNYSDETNSPEDTGARYPANFNSFTMQCSVSFRGFWAPTMQWIQYDSSGLATRQDQLEKDGIKTELIANSRVTSYLTISRDMLHKAGYFSCRTYFERTIDGSLIMGATNIPDFVFVWNSSFYSSPSSSSNTMMQPERHYKHVHGVLWWITVCVLLVLLVIIVTVSTLCYIKNRQSDRRRKREQQEEQKRNATSPESPYENETGQEKHTYAEINESQINPVDNPPKTRPRVKTTTVSTTTLHSTANNQDVLVAEKDENQTVSENNVDVVYFDENEPDICHLDNRSEARSLFESDSAFQTMPHALAKGSYATLAHDTATHRAEVSIHEYDDVALSPCDDVAMYSDVRSNFSQIERHLWTPHYCGFVSAEVTLPTLSTRMEDCREATGSSRQLSRQSPIPEVSRHLKQGGVDSTSRRDVCIDNTLRTIFCNELQDDVIRDEYPEETDYLHFDNKTVRTKLSKAGRCDVIGEVSPFEMDSCYLTMTDIMDSSNLGTTECLDSSYAMTTPDCTDLNSSYLKENPKPAFKGCVTHPVTPKAHTESDSNRQLVLK